MNRPHSLTTASRQRGAVLFISLVFLVLIALLAVVAASNSVLEERMVGGMRNAQLASMGADSVVRGVENMIWNRVDGAGGSTHINCGYNGGGALDKCYARRSDPTSTTTTVGQVNPLTYKFRSARTWLDESSDGALDYAVDMTSSSMNTAKLEQRPRYIIEDVGKVSGAGQAYWVNGAARDPMDTGGAKGQTMHAYRITGRSTGGSKASIRATESIFIALPPSN